MQSWAHDPQPKTDACIPLAALRRLCPDLAHVTPLAMSTQVLIAHSGQRLQVDPTQQFTSVEEFKAWVSRQCRIPVQNVVALSPSGKTVKAVSALNSESDIYVYDMRIVNATSSPSSSFISESPMPKRYTTSNPPNSIANAADLQSWQDLFCARRSWALRVYEECSKMSQAAHARYDEMDVIMKCLDAAVANLETAIKPLDIRYTDLKKWAGPACDEYAILASSWEHYLNIARNVEISRDMVRFMTQKELAKSKRVTLEDLVDVSSIEKLGKRATTSLKSFKVRLQELDDQASKMFQGCQDLFREFDNVVNQSALRHAGETNQLLQDIQPIANKIDTDYRTVTDFKTNRDVARVSKLATTHTENLLPRLRNRALEMDEMLRYAVNKRNELASGSLEFMRMIAEISMLQGSVKSQMNAFSQGVEEMHTFDFLRLVQQLPFMYATYVSESIRRREWVDKMKTDSATLANEMALFQDEEMKRRRKWQKTVGQTYGPESPIGDVTGLEVNLRPENEIWPHMTKDDFQDFIDLLHSVDADREIIHDVRKIFTELTAPTKQQTKRLKAFKNGSMHEASLGRSGLLIRGDNDLMQSLQDDKTRLEAKVKTAESRVRRLEALLHQQSQASRPSPGVVFSPNQHLSERNDSAPSVKSPRPSDENRKSIDGTDVLIQTVQRLEAELATEKQRVATFESDLNTRVKEHNTKLDEVNSTKKDLLGNMEALQREFDIERKSLEDEIKHLKARIEDNEDAMDHFGESRENEKESYDHKIHILEYEIDQLKKEIEDERLKALGQVEFLRTESRLQRERNMSLEKEVQSLTESSNETSKKLADFEDQLNLSKGGLCDLHVQLSAGSLVPSDLGELIEMVTSRAGEVIEKLQNTERDMTLLRSNWEEEQSSAKQLKNEISAAGKRLEDGLEQLVKTKELLGEEKARASILENELAAERKQISDLRTRLSDGETGSDSLRRRLEEEETRSISLREELATKQSQLGGLEEEVLLSREKLEETQSRLANVTGRLEERTERTRDLTQRLYAQNDRLCRLLERLGYSVTRKDGTMVIQKVPRAERASLQPNTGDSSDPSASMRKSVTLNSKTLVDSTDLELLHWMNSEDATVEATRFEAFLKLLGYLDMDLFADTVYKRLKEVEHIARKLQRNAQSYRDKAHVFQKEAHEKIAFKNFKEGDLALFLPTRNQMGGAWAAFNVGFPHYFLREQEQHGLRTREWLVARISRIDEKVVDLSKTLQQPSETDSMNTENENPFDLSDGLRWYLLDAHEDKTGAPTTPGLAKSVVATNTDVAVADRHAHAHTSRRESKPSPSSIEGVSKALTKSLETRRGSTSSKKGLPFSIGGAGRGGGGSNRNSMLASETNSLKAVASDTPTGTSPTGQVMIQALPSPTKNYVHQTAVAEQNIAESGSPSADVPNENNRRPSLEVRTSEVDRLIGP